MIRTSLTIISLGLAPVAGSAKEPLLNLPLDCTMGQDCYINDYFDRDASEGVRDIGCGVTTRDNHRGVDFALMDLEAMRDGVDVIAAAPGTVAGVRNGMPDISATAEDAPDVTGQECGNGVAVSHGGGWVSQYCHLKQDSIVVQKGDRVRLGTVLGQVGLSGQTNYPHLHFTLFKDQVRVDPFNPDMSDTCSIDPGESLWQKGVTYQPSGFIKVGFVGTPPEFENIKDSQDGADEISADAPALVVWTYGYTIKNGDRIDVLIEGPNGVFMDTAIEIERGYKNDFRFTGKRRRDALWPLGDYTATLSLIRGGRTLETQQTSVTITSP